MKALATFLFFICYFLTPVHSQRPCYYPDGTLAPDHRPCLPSQVHSACCAVNNPQGPDYCLSSGLCLGRGYGFMWRNSCTDITWRHMACPSYCTDVRPYQYVGLQSCTSDGAGRWYVNQTQTKSFHLGCSSKIQAKRPKRCCDNTTGTESDPKESCCVDRRNYFNAATGIGTIVSDLSLPVQTQTVHQHSTRRDVLIGLTIGAPLLAMLTASLLAVRILSGNRDKLRKTLSEDLRCSPWQIRSELPAESCGPEMERFGRLAYLFDEDRESRAEPHIQPQPPPLNGESQIEQPAGEPEQPFTVPQYRHSAEQIQGTRALVEGRAQRSHSI